MNVFIDKTGETATMNNGLKATIIAFRNVRDVDVIFENGQIVRKRDYYHFQSGKIKCPVIIEQYEQDIKVTNPNTGLIFWASAEDRELVEKHSWYSSDGYVRGNRCKGIHRMIMNASANMKIDHIDGNPMNNRRNNLRICTVGENNCNRKKSNNKTSRYKGVYWSSERAKWISQIKANGKSKRLGQFSDEIKAAHAYNIAALKYHGEFAKLNEI